MVSDPKTGLLAGINCNFLGKDIRNLYNSICIGLVVPLSTLGTLIAVASFLMFFLSFLAYIIAIDIAFMAKAQEL